MDRIQAEKQLKLVDLLDLDAFRDFSINHLHRWNANTPVIIDTEREIKYSKVWAKTLYTPRKYLSMGVTPMQFFNTLIRLNNEQVNKNTINFT